MVFLFVSLSYHKKIGPTKKKTSHFNWSKLLSGLCSLFVPGSPSKRPRDWNCGSSLVALRRTLAHEQSHLQCGAFQGTNRNHFLTLRCIMPSVPRICLRAPGADIYSSKHRWQQVFSTCHVPLRENLLSQKVDQILHQLVGGVSQYF